ncbi:hypothetical protein WDU94_010773 [Cyamophila willieti]
MYATTHNGWMEETVFYNWIEKMFVPHVQRERAERNLPDQEALLIFDGDASHSSLRIIELAMKNKITMMSHLTDKIQPLDVAVFNPIKILWEKKLIHHGKTQIGKGSGILTKQQFSYLGQMWQDAMKPDNMKKGFEATGIIPFNPNKFDKKLFDKLEKYLTQKKRKETASGSAARLPNPVEELPSPESVRLPARVCTLIKCLIQVLSFQVLAKPEGGKEITGGRGKMTNPKEKDMVQNSKKYGLRTQDSNHGSRGAIKVLLISIAHYVRVTYPVKLKELLMHFVTHQL